jgi:HlyD family secretion protein
MSHSVRPGDGRRRRPLVWMVSILVLGIVATVLVRARLRATPPDLALTTVTRGDFVERLNIRGEIRPVKSVLVTAPGQAGDLLVVKLVKTGTVVKKGDPIATFNPIVLRQQIEDKRSELRQVEADIERTRASGKITDEQNQTQLLKAQYDVERAKLKIGDPKLMPKLDLERAQLDVQNAEQRKIEVEKRAEAGRTSVDADVASRSRQREKVKDELERLERALEASEVFAPADGTVQLMTNGRAPGQVGAPPEFREGDRVWSGAAIAELPDLSSVFVRAQLDEDSRGRMRVGQPALVKVDAITDRELKASIVDISVLARVDIGPNYPPPRNFDLKIRVDENDPRLRPGMSATARIEVDRLPNTLLLPATAVFDVNGRTVVYKLEGATFVEVPLQIARRSHEQVAVAGGVAAGDQVAAKKPLPDQVRSAR